MTSSVRIREAQSTDAFGIARAQVDTSRITYRTLVSRGVMRQLSFAAQCHGWQSVLRRQNHQVVVHVAEAGGELIGFAAGGPARAPAGRYPGELYALYVLPRHQRRGLGTRLFLSVCAALTARGLAPLYLWVVANNPARRFFEGLGGHLLSSAVDPGCDVSAAKVAYGWCLTRAVHGFRTPGLRPRGPKASALQERPS